MEIVSPVVVVDILRHIVVQEEHCSPVEDNNHPGEEVVDTADCNSFLGTSVF